MGIGWKISPADYLDQANIGFRRRGAWLSVERCPVCLGGDHGDTFTFAVHGEQGHYTCLRASCGETGNFWKLIELTGGNPRRYLSKDDLHTKSQKKRYVYGR